MSTISIFVAAQGFRDGEYIVPHAFWVQTGIGVQTVCDQPEAIGRFGYRVEADVLLPEASEGNADALFLVGGGGIMHYADNLALKNLVQGFLDAQKPVGAICAAPRLLLAWGMMQDTSFTGWNGDNALEGLAEECGAHYTALSVCTDGRILTADGPSSAEEAALTFLSLLQKVG